MCRQGIAKKLPNQSVSALQPPHVPKATEAEVEVVLALALGSASPGGGEVATAPTGAPEVPA